MIRGPSNLRPQLTTDIQGYPEGLEIGIGNKQQLNKRHVEINSYFLLVLRVMRALIIPDERRLGLLISRSEDLRSRFAGLPSV